MGRLSERINRRLFLLLLCSFLLVYAFDFATPLLTPTVRAQDGDKAPAPEAAPQASTDGGWFAETRDLTKHMIRSVGCFFGPLLGVVSIILLALIVLLALDLRMSRAIPAGFVEEFTDTVNKRKFKEAYELAKADQSYLGRVLSAGMSRLQYGIDDAREAAFNMVDSIRAGKEQPIAYLATIASLGPLLGLVGTVFGMIQAFMKVSQLGMDAHVIADKISHALVVTMFGVALAVPAICFHALFRNLLNKISLETGNIADDLLTQMYHNSKKTAPTTPVSDAIPASDSRSILTATMKAK